MNTPLTAKQIAAARNYFGWTIDDLARRARVDIPSLKLIDGLLAEPSPNAEARLRHTFEAAGMIFPESAMEDYMTRPQEAPNETAKKLISLQDQHQKAVESLMNYARSLVPVLEDHNLINTAKPLKEVLFQIDASRQEMTDLVRANPLEALAGLINHLKK